MANYLLRKTPDKLWHRVKIQVSKEATTIRAIILELLEQWLKRKERP